MIVEGLQHHLCVPRSKILGQMLCHPFCYAPNYLVLHSEMAGLHGTAAAST
jgi:hypothetical protein